MNPSAGYPDATPSSEDQPGYEIHPDLMLFAAGNEDGRLWPLPEEAAFLRGVSGLIKNAPLPSLSDHRVAMVLDETREGPTVAIFGSYRDRRPRARARKSRALLRRVEQRLIDAGVDACTQLHPRAEAIVGSLKPGPMTRAMERAMDICVYIVEPNGANGGWAAEIADGQARYPEGASKRVVLVQERCPIPAVLDEDESGFLSEPPVLVIPWEGEDDLVETIMRLVAHYDRYGHLPRKVRDRGS